MSRLKAIGYMCFAVLLFSLLDSSSKVATSLWFYPLVMVIWLRYCLHVLGLYVYAPKKFHQALTQSKAPFLQCFRSLSMLGATILNFGALMYLQYDQATAILFITPLLVALLSSFVLNETIGFYRLTAILVAFVGVIIIMNPRMEMHFAVFLSLGAAFSLSIYQVLTRLVSRYDNHYTSQVWAPLGGLLLFAIPAYFFWRQPESLSHWLLLLSLGFWGGIGHTFYVIAHQNAPAPTLAPFIYVAAIIAPIIGYLFFGEVPDWHTVWGALIVIASGLFLLYREAHLEKQA